MLDNNVTLHIYNDLAMKFWLESLTTYKKQEPTSSLSHLTSSWIRFRQEVQIFLFLPLCRPSLSTSQNFNSGSVAVLGSVKSECPQRPWCGQQHEAFGGISRLIKWITLFKITRKGWWLTSTVFLTRKRKIMKTFRIKNRQKTSTIATHSKMAADVRKLPRSIWTSSPYAMATKLGKSKSDDTETKFSSKNRLKSKF